MQWLFIPSKIMPHSHKYQRNKTNLISMHDIILLLNAYHWNWHITFSNARQHEHDPNPAWLHHLWLIYTSTPSLGYFSQWPQQFLWRSSTIHLLQQHGWQSPTSQLLLQLVAWLLEILHTLCWHQICAKVFEKSICCGKCLCKCPKPLPL